MNKIAARKLQEEFIPTGPAADISTLTFRRTKNTEIFRCAVATGTDIQSGPFYCGRIAEFVAFVERDGEQFSIALCGIGSHRPPRSTT